MERYTRPRLPRGYRILAGLGLWAAGMSATIGALNTSVDTMGTKIALFSAQMNGDAARLSGARNTLRRQHTQLWVNLASSVLCLSMGARMTRDLEQLWSGPAYGQAGYERQMTAETTPAILAAPPETSETSDVVVIYVDFGKHAA